MPIGDNSSAESTENEKQKLLETKKEETDKNKKVIFLNSKEYEQSSISKTDLRGIIDPEQKEKPESKSTSCCTCESFLDWTGSVLTFLAMIPQGVFGGLMSEEFIKERGWPIELAWTAFVAIGIASHLGKFFIVRLYNTEDFKGLAKGYDLELMSKLPNNDKNQAEAGKIYLSTDGTYVVKDLKGIVQIGSLKDSDIDLGSLPNFLADKTLKKRILEVISKAGHIQSNCEDFGKEYFNKGKKLQSFVNLIIGLSNVYLIYNASKTFAGLSFIALDNLSKLITESFPNANTKNLTMVISHLGMKIPFAVSAFFCNLLAFKNIHKFGMGTLIDGGKYLLEKPGFRKNREKGERKIEYVRENARKFAKVNDWNNYNNFLKKFVTNQEQTQIVALKNIPKEGLINAIITAKLDGYVDQGSEGWPRFLTRHGLAIGATGLSAYGFYNFIKMTDDVNDIFGMSRVSFLDGWGDFFSMTMMAVCSVYPVVSSWLNGRKKLDFDTYCQKFWGFALTVLTCLLGGLPNAFQSVLAGENLFFNISAVIASALVESYAAYLLINKLINKCCGKQLSEEQKTALENDEYLEKLSDLSNASEDEVWGWMDALNEAEAEAESKKGQTINNNAIQQEQKKIIVVSSESSDEEDSRPRKYRCCPSFWSSESSESSIKGRSSRSSSMGSATSLPTIHGDSQGSNAQDPLLDAETYNQQSNSNSNYNTFTPTPNSR